MIKVNNIVVNTDRITMDCLKNGNEEDRYHIVLDGKTLEILECTEDNVYVQRAVAMVRKHLRDNGKLPEEFTSVWH